MIIGKIEAVLFAAAKPIPVKTLIKVMDTSEEVMREALDDISGRFNTEASGIHLLEHDGKVQFVTNPEMSEIVKGFVKEDVGGELTRPSLETLTIIAYRGPITKPEIEQIRGINCSLILRNLLIRGLIKEEDDKEKLQPVYTVSTDFVRHLGLHSIAELPNYEEMHSSERITKLLEELAEQSNEEV